jgi:flagellar biosynthetic protein FliQ
LTSPQVLDLAKDSIWTLLIVSTPLMLIGLTIGLMVALVQALTQIQEMTLVFVPKIIAMFLGMIFLLPFMGQAMNGYMQRIMALIVSGG